MPTDLTGTPTSLGIGTYNVDADAPSGLGFNEAMAQIDALIAARIGTPAGITTGEIPVWNGSTWVRSSTQRPAQSSLGTGTPGILTFLRGDGAWAEGGLNVLYDTVDAGVTFPSAQITTPTLPTGSFRHMLVAYTARSDAAVLFTDLNCQIGVNGGAIDNGASNYNTQRIYAVGNSAATAAPVGANNISTPDWIVGAAIGASGDNNTYGNGFFVVSNAAGVASGRAGFTGISIGQVGTSSGDGANRLTIHSGFYKNTVGPVTKLNFFPLNGNLTTGSRFTIYAL